MRGFRYVWTDCSQEDTSGLGVGEGVGLVLLELRPGPADLVGAVAVVVAVAVAGVVAAAVVVVAVPIARPVPIAAAVDRATRAFVNNNERWNVRPTRSLARPSRLNITFGARTAPEAKAFQGEMLFLPMRDYTHLTDDQRDQRATSTPLGPVSCDSGLSGSFGARFKGSQRCDRRAAEVLRGAARLLGAG
jgi:hypothetical protein